MKFICATMCFLLSGVVFSSEADNHHNLSKELLACGYFYKILPEINEQLSDADRAKKLDELSEVNASLAIFISGKEYVNGVIESAVSNLESEINALEKENGLNGYVENKIHACTIALETAKNIKRKKIILRNTTLVTAHTSGKGRS